MMVMSGIVGGVVLLAALTVWLRARWRLVTVVGDSMRPTLRHGDQLLVRRTPLSRVRVGDIVVLAMPRACEPEDVGPDDGVAEPDARAETSDSDSDTDTDRSSRAQMPDSRTFWLVKRVVAVAGDPTPDSVATAAAVPGGAPVPTESLVVLSDNPGIGHDSRLFGYVPADHVFGVVARRVDPTAGSSLAPSPAATVDASVADVV